MATVHTLKQMFGRIVDHANLHHLDRPTITTDLSTAHILVECLAEDLCCSPSRLIPSFWMRDVYAMYDGIKIVALSPGVCKPPVDGWREHFGALAEIWEA